MFPTAEYVPFYDVRRFKNSIWRHTNVSDTGVVSLSALVRLEGLWLNSTKITGAGFSSFKDLHKLNTISLRDSIVVTDEGVAELAACSSLAEIHLDNTNISRPRGCHPSSKLPKLSKLSLGGTKVSKKARQQLKKSIFRNLTVSLIGTPHLSPAAPPETCRCTMPCTPRSPRECRRRSVGRLCGLPPGRGR